MEEIDAWDALVAMMTMSDNDDALQEVAPNNTCSNLCVSTNYKNF
jgi:hypothetical protein